MVEVSRSPVGCPERGIIIYRSVVSRISINMQPFGSLEIQLCTQVVAVIIIRVIPEYPGLVIIISREIISDLIASAAYAQVMDLAGIVGPVQFVKPVSGA